MRPMVLREIADMLTLQEHWGSLRGRRLAFVGDGNNVATSLAHATALLGISLHVASPRGYELPEEVVRAATRAARPTVTGTSDRSMTRASVSP